MMHAYQMGVTASTLAPAVPHDPTTTPGLNLWLDASDATSLDIVSGRVLNWRDKSGNGNDATQGNAGLQGAFSTANFASGAVSFTNTEGMTFPTVTLTTSAVIFMVAYWKQSSAYRSLTLSNSSTWETGGDHFGIFSTTSPSFPMTQGSMEIGDSGSRYIQSDVNTIPTGAAVLEFVVSPTLSNNVVLRNGVDLTSIKNGISWNITLDRICSQTTYLGNGSELAEVLVYQGALSDADRDTLRTYLSNKWGIVF